MPIPRTLNQAFFKTWSPSMAYVLGFFAADGTMIANNRGAHFIEFHITDKEVLLQIRSAVGSNHKIGIRNRNVRETKWKTGYRLQIGSKEWFADLNKLGFAPNKSLVLKFPKIPNKFFGHFVRGYFDGDGCVHFKKYFAKDRGKMKWSFSSRFTSGSEVFLLSLHKALRQHGVQKGFIYKKQRGNELVLSHKDSIALFRIMYDTLSNNDLYLARKHLLFKKAIKTLYGDVAQLV